MSQSTAGYRALYPNEPLATWTTYAVLVTGFIVGVLAAVFGAVQGLTTESGLHDESDFAFKASLWLFVFGIVLVVAIVIFAIDAWIRHYDYYISAPGWMSYFWGLLAFFLALPWNVLGHIFLLRKWTATGDWTATAVYILVIVAVVVAYVIALGMVRYVAYVLFVHNWQIGVSRRYLTALSDAAQQGARFPVLEERHRTLPYIMGVQDVELNKQL